MHAPGEAAQGDRAEELANELAEELASELVEKLEEERAEALTEEPAPALAEELTKREPCDCKGENPPGRARCADNGALRRERPRIVCEASEDHRERNSEFAPLRASPHDRRAPKGRQAQR